MPVSKAKLSKSIDAVSDEDITKIVQICHDAPHRVLGPHRSPDRQSTIVRVFMPDARRASVRLRGPRTRDYPMTRIHAEGFFEVVLQIPGENLSYLVIVTTDQGETVEYSDPYAFDEPWFTTEDEDSLLRGTHCRLHEKLGAHLQRRGGSEGAAFAVWAPHAERVSVVGTFNHWDGRRHPMRRLPRSGVWDLFVPDVSEGDLYKFEIRSSQGHVFLKGDPFARRTELAPATASIVTNLERTFCWSDAAWMNGERARLTNHAHLVIRRFDRLSSATSGELGDDLSGVTGPAMAAALTEWRKLGTTHVELTTEPDGHSSKNAGVFAPSEDRQTPERLMAFIDGCHRAGLAVILPVPDSTAPQRYSELAWFDGSPLFETDSDAAANVLDINKPEVRSFLLSNARYWFTCYHADGWRTDLRTARVIRQLAELDPEEFAGVPIFVREEGALLRLSEHEVARLVAGRHDHPHALLGPRYLANTRELTIRAMLPGADRAWVRFPEDPRLLYELHRIHGDGLFETTLSDSDECSQAYRLIILDGDGRCEERLDPYAFTVFEFSDMDQRLFGAGRHYRIYDKLGAHLRCHGETTGVRFSLWAPSADGVSVVGPFNRWDGRRHPMHRHGLSGVWEIFIPELGEGEIYKFEIRARNGHTYLKADPYAFYAEVSPATASIVYRLQGAHPWQDQTWMEQRRRTRTWEQPLTIYEVHIGSWMRDGDRQAPGYRATAERLIAYVKEVGFTHIELLPITEYPYEPSWGYQVTGYYAPSSRYGRPEDLMYFIDLCHQNGIGVLLDWVAGHFPKDAHGLAWFDGTGLYEHEDPRKGEHRDWGTLIFNYGRHEVANFLTANALFWLEHYHFDGLRVDAVASMLYLDYSRTNPGDWIPNQYGGRENLEAIDFLRQTNTVVHRDFPGVMMIAEESTAWPNVSRPVEQGGLGFGYKWNMGWMHDVLTYLGTSPEDRKHHHHQLTFSLVYAFAENYVLSLSHDEVVHMKHSLLNKMPGSEWEQFANLRLLYAFMYAHPGKKLLFMGAEFGQRGEWNHAASLEWDLLEREPHRCLAAFVRDLNSLYRSDPAFFEVDFRAVGFEWLEADNAEESVVTFLRKAKDPRNTLLFVMNFSSVSRPWHRIGVPFPVYYQLVFNTNASRYGGADTNPTLTAVAAEERPWHGREFSITLPLPALSAVILRPAPPIA